MKKLLIILTLFTSLISCQSAIFPEVLHETPNFAITLPTGWKHEKLQGTDSIIGIFTNQIDTLRYDYGRYTNGFDYEFGDNSEYSITPIQIHSRKGQWLIPSRNKPGITGVFLRVEEHKTLTITGRVNNPKEYWAIFNTIRFK